MLLVGQTPLDIQSDETRAPRVVKVRLLDPIKREPQQVNHTSYSQLEYWTSAEIYTEYGIGRFTSAKSTVVYSIQFLYSTSFEQSDAAVQILIISVLLCRCSYNDTIWITELGEFWIISFVAWQNSNNPLPFHIILHSRVQKIWSGSTWIACFG